MGKVEKWVVLGVLALIVGILVVSLTVDDPLKRKDVVVAGTPGGVESGGSQGAAPVGGSGAAAKPEVKPVALLNSSVSERTAEPEPVAAPVATIPPGSILKSMDGLEASYMTDMKFYTWKSDDSFPALAQRYYGDLARLGTLRRVNEGRADVQPGDRVLIPVFDLDAPQDSQITPTTPGTAASAAPRTAIASGALSNSATPPSTSKSKDSTGARVHVVQEGESLWVISKKELGAGARWKEIYDANRDQLSSPEALHTGIKLRIP